MKTTTRGLLRNSTQQGPALKGENKGENCSNPELCLTITMRYNADGQPLSSVQKQIISQLSPTLESKSVFVSERGLTSTKWSEYSENTKRIQYSVVPTSDITAEAVTVDGFALSQKDTAGVVTTATRPLAIQKDATWYAYGWGLTKNICELSPYPILRGDSEIFQNCFCSKYCFQPKYSVGRSSPEKELWNSPLSYIQSLNPIKASQSSYFSKSWTDVYGTCIVFDLSRPFRSKYLILHFKPGENHPYSFEFTDTLVK